MRLLKRYSQLCLIALIVSSCYPTDLVSDEELDIVATFYDIELIASQDFSTYVIPDSVLHQDSDGTSNHSFDDLILTTIKDNLESYGYQEISTTSMQTPDLVVLPEVITQSNYEIGGCWDCWGWWDPWYPGWGWGYYPPYPPGYVYSYKTGTILISLLDQSQVSNQNEEANAVWVAFINGLLRSDITGADIQAHIQQAFDQSPYLQTN